MSITKRTPKSFQRLYIFLAYTAVSIAVVAISGSELAAIIVGLPMILLALPLAHVMRGTTIPPFFAIGIPVVLYVTNAFILAHVLGKLLDRCCYARPTVRRGGEREGE